MPNEKQCLPQNGGDVCCQYWRSAIPSSPEAVRHSKVKGHATDEMVQSGGAQKWSKEGNDHGDMCADQVVICIRNVLRQSSWCDSNRQLKYQALALRCDAMM